VVERVEGDRNRLVKSFQVFCPVAMAGLGKLPETVEQRSIVVRMKRRRPDEDVAKLRRRQVAPEADALRARLEAWAAAHLGVLSAAEPDVPDELDDRSQDIWEPLVAIADTAGGDWPSRARTAAVALFSARDADDATLGVRLLTDVRTVFEETGKDGFASGDLAGHLALIEGAPWYRWGKDDKPLTAHALAQLLRRYEIKPRQHRIGGDSFRGYVRADFDDAFTRYLGPSPYECNNATSATSEAQ
jgi:hypothetical protein